MRYLTFLLCVVALGLFSCSEEADLLYPDPLNPNQETFTSKLVVRIQTSTGDPMPDVEVRVGSLTAKSDLYGFVALPRVELGASNYLTAKKSGYFDGSRRFNAKPGATSYITISMLSAAIDETFSADQGTTVSLPGQVQLDFPADGYTYSDGRYYSGQVHVAVAPIPADDAELFTKMPGDLSGTNAANEVGSLGSFGMVAVELTSPDGSALQLAEGSEVTMHMPIPDAMLDKSPATIALWYFDEDLGIWREEGAATKTGNAYVGNVSHFSFWNCDAWFPVIQLDAQFVNANGDPVTQTKVCININSLNTRSCAYTDSEGRIGGLVAKDEILTVEVYNACYDLLYEEAVGPFAADVVLSPVVLNTPDIFSVHVSGTAVDCQAEAVGNGFALINVGQHEFLAFTDTDGFFETQFIVCEPSDLEVIVFDPDHQRQSAVMGIPFAENIDTDTIEVCQDWEDLENLAIIYIEGVPDPVYMPFLRARFTEDAFTVVYGFDSLTYSFHLVFPGMQVGTYPDADVSIHVDKFTENALRCEVADLVVTEYDFPDGIISGTLSGTLHDDPNQQGYPFTGTFSAKLE